MTVNLVKKTRTLKCSVIGLGKLGAPLSAVLASKGFEVIGLDINPDFVKSINEGKAPVVEPQLQEYLNRAGTRLRATMDMKEAVLGTDITFVIVPTPSNAQGIFTNQYVIEAVKAIGAALQLKKSYHLVNITSTVMPGSTQGVIRQALETSSGRVLGENLGLCYNPEFIALGTVVRDMLNPDMVLIGQSDTQAGDMLEAIYAEVSESNPKIQRMNLINAEIAKIAVNTFVTTKISYANMLADLCDYLPDADVNAVTDAIGSDSRIGHKYLRGGLAYGGPCFPRDNQAFVALAKSLGAMPDLAEATDSINLHQATRINNKLAHLGLKPGATIAILGLSYKPNTPVVEASPSLSIVRQLVSEGYKLKLYDPEALENAMLALGRHENLMASQTAQSCISEADAIIIATAWPEFKKLPLELLKRKQDTLIVIDVWRLLDVDTYSADVHLVYLGLGPQNPKKSHAFIEADTTKIANLA